MTLKALQKVTAERDRLEMFLASAVKAGGEQLREIDRLKAINAELLEALKRVADWDLPSVVDRDGKPSSFTVEYGSDGARDFIRGIASAAIAVCKLCEGKS